MKRTTRHRAAWGLVAAGFSLAVAASGNATTYAAFSDFDSVADNHVGAGRVAIGLPGGTSHPTLAYADVLPAAPRTDSLQVTYLGTTPGDLALELRPDGGSPFCAQSVDGSWHAQDGGSLQISVGSAWADYCTLLDEGHSLPLRTGVAPGATVNLDVRVQLAPGTDFRYSQLSDVDRLTLTARQTSLPTGGFTDFAVGAISIGTGTIDPVVPDECLAEGMDDFDADNTFVLTAGDDTFSTPPTPEHGRGYLVFGVGGNDRITGSNQADCLVGGDGNDALDGGNQHDVLLGGAGDDLLTGSAMANGKDLLYGGDGADELHGENGKDHLSGGEGNDTLFGGNAPDGWSPEGGTDTCIDPSADEDDFDAADYGGCEIVKTSLGGEPLTAATATTFGLTSESVLADPPAPTEEPSETTEEPVEEQSAPEQQTDEEPAEEPDEEQPVVPDQPATEQDQPVEPDPTDTPTDTETTEPDTQATDPAGPTGTGGP